MRKIDCAAMIMAGGQACCLGPLTARIAAPAVSFGGTYRLIDFPLSSCAHSGIPVVFVLPQRGALSLNAYLGSGEAWNLDNPGSGLYLLDCTADRCSGTAEAVRQSLRFLRPFSPETVLILTGAPLGVLDFQPLLDFHRSRGAELTIMADAAGALSAAEDGRLRAAEPENPEERASSMGIYLFSYRFLLQILGSSQADLEQDLIPALLKDGRRIFVYRHHGFFRKLDTLQAYYDSQMELVTGVSGLPLHCPDFPILTKRQAVSPQYLSPECAVSASILSGGCQVGGTVRRSLLSTESVVRPGAVVEDSILLPGAVVEENAKVTRCILGEHAVVRTGVQVGRRTGELTVLSELYSL